MKNYWYLLLYARIAVFQGQNWIKLESSEMSISAETRASFHSKVSTLNISVVGLVLARI